LGTAANISATAAANGFDSVDVAIGSTGGVSDCLSQRAADATVEACQFFPLA